MSYACSTRPFNSSHAFGYYINQDEIDYAGHKLEEQDMVYPQLWQKCLHAFGSYPAIMKISHCFKTSPFLLLAPKSICATVEPRKDDPSILLTSCACNDFDGCNKGDIIEQERPIDQERPEGISNSGNAIFYKVTVVLMVTVFKAFL